MKQPIMEFEAFGKRKVHELGWDEEGNIDFVSVYFPNRLQTMPMYTYNANGILPKGTFSNSHGNVIGKLIFDETYINT